MYRILKEKYFKIISTCILLLSSVNISFAARVGKLYADRFKPMMNMINVYVQYFSIFITVLALLSFVYNVIRIGTSQGRADKREDAIRGLMISGVVAALVPFSTSILVIFFNFTTP